MQKLITFFIISYFIFLVPAISLAIPPHYEVVGQSLRGYASTLIVDQNRAYVTMGAALVVFDISDPSLPKEVGREYAVTCFDANPTLAKVFGRTYFIVSSDLYGIYVFDVTNDDVNLKFILFDPQPGSKIDPGGGVFYKEIDNTGYLFCANGGRGLKIYKVVADQENGIKGFILIGTFLPPPEKLPKPMKQDYYSNVFIKDNQAYISARSSGLHIWDISDPTSPIFKNYYGADLIQWTIDTIVYNNIAIIGHSGFKRDCTLEIVDISDPSHIIRKGCYINQKTYFDFFRSISLKEIDDGFLLSAANATEGYYFFQIPHSMDSITLLDIFNNGGYAAAINNYHPFHFMAYCLSGFFISKQEENNTWNYSLIESDDARDLVIVSFPENQKIAYIADGAKGIVAVNISEPYHPGKEESILTGVKFHYVNGIAYKEPYLFLSDEKNGIYVFKIKAPFQLELMNDSPYPTGGTGKELLIKDNNLFVADGENGVTKFQINESEPILTFLLNIKLADIIKLVEFNGRIFALGSPYVKGGMNFFILDPLNLSIRNQIPIPANSTNDVAFYKNIDKLYAYVALTGRDGSEKGSIEKLEIVFSQDGKDEIIDRGYFEINSALNPSFPEVVRSVEVINKMLFVVHQNAGLYTFNLSDPLNPLQEAEFLLSANNNTYEFLYDDGYWYNAHGDAGLFILKYHGEGPFISSISPSHGKVGTQVTIQGSNFGDIQGKSYVDFNGTMANEYISWSNTKVVVIVPSNATSGLVTIVVNNEVSNGVYFTVDTRRCGIFQLNSYGLGFMIEFCSIFFIIWRLKKK